MPSELGARSSFRIKRSAIRNLCFLAFCALGGIILAKSVTGDNVSDRAKKLHFSSILVDTHDDTTQLLLDPKFDLGQRHSKGSIDIPRMRDGGLGAIFFSIWLPSKITGAPAVQKALDQIDAVREQVRNHPKDLTLATTAGQIREAHKDGKIAALLGVEGGHEERVEVFGCGHGEIGMGRLGAVLEERVYILARDAVRYPAIEFGGPGVDWRIFVGEVDTA